MMIHSEETIDHGQCPVCMLEEKFPGMDVVVRPGPAGGMVEHDILCDDHLMNLMIKEGD